MSNGNVSDQWNESFIDWNIAELATEQQKVYAFGILSNRVVPILIDGLKPSARRMLYIMYLKDHGKSYRKVASITGETIARLHMHAATSVYDVLVGSAQWWNNMIPLVDGYGNLGSISGDEAGAERYIQARLSEFAYECFFRDWRESSVDMIMGADNETKEPLYLPSKYPTVLLNGVLGIGYGRSTNIPPYCFREIVDATIKLMANPSAKFLLVPDSPTGCDVIESNYHRICEEGIGTYQMRCRYEIDPDNNIITVSALPYRVTVNSIREKIAEIKEKGGLPELISMQDHSGESVNLRLFVRNDVNPYKFMGKLIDTVQGLQKSYPVNITIIVDFKAYDWSVRQVLLEWIKYRREQKRVVINHRRTSLLADQRTNDVKLFVMEPKRLDETIRIFRTGKNRTEIEKLLVERYRDSDIRMDSLQARVLADMRLHELSVESYQKCLERKEEIEKELAEVSAILGLPDGIDRVIISELRDGVKRFGTDRKSRVVPLQLSKNNEASGTCVLQLSSDGTVRRRLALGTEEEPVPTDAKGFALKTENDSVLVAIDTAGRYSMLKVKEIPLDSDVPLLRYIGEKLDRVVALFPHDDRHDRYCVLISAMGITKRIQVSKMKPSSKPCIGLGDGDSLVSGIIVSSKVKRELLVYTEHGYGQRFDPSLIKPTLVAGKGNSGFKLTPGDRVAGCYRIDPHSTYLLYVTTGGKGRLNETRYLPTRKAKTDQMVSLIKLNERDTLLGVYGCERDSELTFYLSNDTTENVKCNAIQVGTMHALPQKLVQAPMVSNRVIKVTMV